MYQSRVSIPLFSHLSDLGQRHLHAPELALVAQAKLADELELGVEALLLERAARLLEGLADWC